MKERKFDWMGLITGLGELLVAILLFVNPQAFTSGVIVAAGVLLGLLGAKSLYDYFKEEPKAAANGNGFLMGTGCLLGGLFCVFAAQWVGTSQPMLSLVYGAILLVAGLVKLQDTVDMLRLKFKNWYTTGISAAAAIIFAVVILLNPFGEDVQSLCTFAAVALVVKAALDLVAAFIGRPVTEEKEEKETEEEEEKSGKIKVKVKEKAKEAE